MARALGQPNSKTLQAITALVEKGCDPLAILADIAMGVIFTKQTGETMEPTLDQRMNCAKELCQYIYPKRKAIEHSGIDGAAIVQFTASDADILNQYFKKDKKDA